MCPVTMTAIGTAIASGLSSIGAAIGGTAAGGAAAAGAAAFPTTLAGAGAALSGLTYSATAPIVTSLAGAGAAAASSIGSTVKTVGTALSIGSTLLSGVAQYQGAQAQSEALLVQQRQDQIRARDALERGERESDRQRLSASRILGEQKARAAAAGVDPNTGSALDLLDDTAFIQEQDAFTIRSNATRQSDGYQVSAVNAGAASSAASRQGLFDAGGTILTGASRVAGRWQAFQTGSY